MPRNAGIAVENNFKNGLITEATGLNFPEAACTETWNCVFNFDGSVGRRFGFDFEFQAETKTINRTSDAIAVYLWENVTADGNLSLLVKQVGDTIYFYRMDEESVSAGAIAATITLSPVSGAGSFASVEAQFESGNGYLIITHPNCNVLRVSFNEVTNAITTATVNIQIRDTEGVDDGLTIDNRPTSTLAGLDPDHLYNLLNQGWTNGNLNAWDIARTDMPSNVDVMWRFKNASDVFDTSTVANVIGGNSPAPRGHYILNLMQIATDRANAVAPGVLTNPGTNVDGQRPSTSTWFAGRMFYAGINSPGYNSKIYFTQIIERVEQYGFAYQANDPTAEDLFDLLPSDGGVISIPEAGTIFKLIPVPAGLAIFASNGVWFVTGSQGLGFTANDYTIQKISSIETISATSFVDVQGQPCWWNAEGIYILVAEGNFPKVQPLSDPKIKSFYNEIPLASKRYARGAYNAIDNTIQWLYRSTESATVEDTYSFDRILNLDISTGAFYPWTISDSDVKVHAIFVSDVSSGTADSDTVVTNAADTVTTSGGDTVVIFTNTADLANPTFKYVVSYADGGSYEFIFAEASNENYIDWFQYDQVGVNYDSYFTSGFRIRGEGLRKFQSNWLRLFSRINGPVSYYVQGIWDYASTGSGTGRWSSRQLVQHTDTNYSTAMARRKIRGHGVALQFRIDSVDGEPFDIIGWSSLDMVNATP